PSCATPRLFTVQLSKDVFGVAYGLPAPAGRATELRHAPIVYYCPTVKGRFRCRLRPSRPAGRATALRPDPIRPHHATLKGLTRAVLTCHGHPMHTCMCCFMPNGKIAYTRKFFKRG